MTNLASSVTWGESYGSPKITVSYNYEYKRVGADMQYRVQITINPVSGIRYFGYPIYAQVSLDGNLKNSATLKNASPSQWTSAITYTTPWLTVTGKTTGSTALLIKLYSGSGSSRTETYNYDLIVSPAASTVTAVDGIIGSPVSITIISNDSSFSHILKYSFGSTTGTIDSLPWTPLMSLCSQIPNALSGTCTITCETYSGSTPVGSTNCTVKLTVPKSVQLEVTDGWASVSVYNTGTAAANIPVFVQGYSKAQVTFDANKISTKNSYGATPKSYKIVFGRTTITSSPYITPILTNEGTMTLYCYVTDTRDRTVGSEIKFYVQPYSVPTISEISLFRCNSSGEEDSTGNYIYVKATSNYSSLNGKNSITFRVRYGVNANNYGSYSTLASEVASILGNGTLLSTSSYIVEISIIDALGKNSIYTGNIPTDDVTFHLGKGGKRAAFFKYAEKDNTLEVDGDLDVTGNIFANNIKDVVTEQGTYDIWTYRKWENGIVECWCKTSFTSGIWSNYSEPIYYGVTQIIALPAGLFIENPMSNVTVQSASGAVVWCCLSTTTTTDVSNYFARLLGGDNSIDIYCTVHLTGKWK